MKCGAIEMSFQGLSTPEQQHSLWTRLSHQAGILLNAGFVTWPLPPLLVHVVRHHGSLVEHSHPAQLLQATFIDCFSILVEAGVFGVLEQGQALLNGCPHVGLWTQQVRGPVLTLVSHFGAWMNVETHIIKTEIRSFFMKLSSKSNFP